RSHVARRLAESLRDVRHRHPAARQVLEVGEPEQLAEGPDRDPEARGRPPPRLEEGVDQPELHLPHVDHRIMIPWKFISTYRISEWSLPTRPTQPIEVPFGNFFPAMASALLAPQEQRRYQPMRPSRLVLAFAVLAAACS